MIHKNKTLSEEEKSCCLEILTLHDNTKKEWQLGKTKVQLLYTHL